MQEIPTSNTQTPNSLPFGWQRVAVGDVCENRIQTRDPRKAPDQPFIYVDISSVDNVSKRIVTPKKLQGADAPSRARQVIHTNDVLVSTTRPNLNAVVLVPDELHDQICSTGFCVLRTSDRLDPTYLFWFVQTSGFVRALSDLVKGALYPAVTNSQVRSLLLPLPPLPEQRRIAALLNEQMATVDRARVAVEEQGRVSSGILVGRLKAVFESAAASQWSTATVGAITKTTSGATPPRGNKHYFDGRIPWVKTAELQDGLIRDTEEHVSEAAVHDTSLKLLPVGTVLVAMYGQGQTRGRTGLLAALATTNQACFAILPNPSTLNPRFLQWWFRCSYDRLRKESESRGGNQPNLNGDLLRNQIVPLPSLTEQRCVADRLDEQNHGLTRLRIALKEQLDAINRLPAALLRRAFAVEL